MAEVIENRVYISFQSRCCFVYLQNDAYDDFVRNPDNSIRMDIAMVYDENGCHRTTYEDNSPDSFNGFVSCLEKDAREAKDILKDSTISLTAEDSDDAGLMLIDSETHRSVSCRQLLKDYLSTFNFLRDNPEHLTIFLSLPPEYDDIQKYQFIKTLKQVTTAKVIYCNPLYALFIETCGPQDGFSRDNIKGSSMMIFNLGYYFSMISIVNYDTKLTVKSSIVSATLSIKNLCRMVSESLIRDQLSGLAHDWTEKERNATLFELMKLVMRSPHDIKEIDCVNIDFGNLPGGNRRRIALTIDHFNQCDTFINELNRVIDDVLERAGMSLASIRRFGIYSELNVHSMIMDRIANKVGEEKFICLANSGEDYLVVGLLWLESYFNDCLIDGDSLIRETPPIRMSNLNRVGSSPHPPFDGGFQSRSNVDSITDGESDSSVNIVLDRGSDITDSIVINSPEGSDIMRSTDSLGGSDIMISTNSLGGSDIIRSTNSPGGSDIIRSTNSPGGSDNVISTGAVSPPKSPLKMPSEVLRDFPTPVSTPSPSVESGLPVVDPVVINPNPGLTIPSAQPFSSTIEATQTGNSSVDESTFLSTSAINRIPNVAYPAPPLQPRPALVSMSVAPSSPIRISKTSSSPIIIPMTSSDSNTSHTSATNIDTSVPKDFTNSQPGSPSPEPIGPPIGPICPNVFQNPQKLDEYLKKVKLPDVVRQFYQTKMGDLCDDDYFIENEKILQKNQLPFATYEYVIKESAQMMISLSICKGKPNTRPFGYAKTTIKEIRQGTKYYFNFTLEKGSLFFSVKDEIGNVVCSRKRIVRSSWSV